MLNYLPLTQTKLASRYMDSWAEHGRYLNKSGFGINTSHVAFPEHTRSKYSRTSAEHPSESGWTCCSWNASAVMQRPTRILPNTAVVMETTSPWEHRGWNVSIWQYSRTAPETNSYWENHVVNCTCGEVNIQAKLYFYIDYSSLKEGGSVELSTAVRLSKFFQWRDRTFLLSVQWNLGVNCFAIQLVLHMHY